MSRASELERRYRQLIRCYPALWRRHRADEMVGVLLDQAAAEGRTTVSLAVAVDLVGHGLEERLDSQLRWLPVRLREQVAIAAVIVAAGLSLVLLGGEVVGAHFRATVGEAPGHSNYFESGPFLSIGVGLYLALVNAALLVVLGRGGAARLLALTSAASGLAMLGLDGPAGLPAPRPIVLVLLSMVAVLSALTRITLTHRSARVLVGYLAGFSLATLGGVALTRPVLGWSIGTMATSGNVAFAALATALPFVGAAALTAAALRSRRHPGWPAAIAVTASPVVIFCTTISQAVNPAAEDGRALIPLCYLLVVVLVAGTYHRGRRHIRVS